MTRVGESLLIVPTGRRVPDALLREAVASAFDRDLRAHVVVPVYLPPQLPISAYPDHLAASVEHQRRIAETAIRSLNHRGRVEEIRCRSIPQLIESVADATRPVEIVLVGGASWATRRAARVFAPTTVLLPSRLGRRRGAVRTAPAVQPTP